MPRRGATTVEFALVCSVFFMFLFGVFEYCRYLVLVQACTNAARDAARFASVNVNYITQTNPAPTPSQDFRSTQFDDPGYPALGDAGYDGTRPVFVVPAVRAYLLGPYDNGKTGAERVLLPQGRLGGLQRMLQPVASGAELVQVYPCDPTTLYANPPTFAPRVQPQTVNGVVQPAVWNRAQFTERVAVRITGTYTPVLPTFLKMQNIRRVNIVAVMGSEG